MKTLKEVMPYEFENEFKDVEAYKYKDNIVVKEFFGYTSRPWVGKHKNVHYWCVLDNGKAIGWNENPSTGYSFPVEVYKEYMSVLGIGAHSIVYSLGDVDVCLKKTTNYKEDAFYKVISLPKEIRKKHKIVPVYQVGVYSDKDSFYVLKKLYPIEVSYKDCESLQKFNDFHNAEFEDKKLLEICLIAKDLLEYFKDCELDLQDNIMQDKDGNYYLTDPIDFTL